MPTQNGTTRSTSAPERSRADIETVAAFLLCLEEQERAGLNRRCAVLAAGSELGVDPAAVVRRVRQAAS